MRALQAARIGLGALLIGAGFFTAYLSEPRVRYLHEGKALSSWDNQATFREGGRGIGIQVHGGLLHGMLRARFSACPVDPLPGCEPDKAFSLPVPASGLVLLRFPEGKLEVSLQVFRPPFQPLFLALLALWAAGFALLFSGPARLLVLGGLLLFGSYLSVTQGEVRALDVEGHIRHVERIAIDGPWVKAGACWECFQPPVYYTLASALLGFPREIGAPETLVLHALTLFCFLLSLPLIVGILRPFAGSQRDLLLFSALAAFWPAGVIHSVRVGNDGLAMLAGFLCLFLLLRKRWLMAAGAAGLCLLVKNSGVVLVVFAGAWVALQFWRSEISPRRAALCLLLLAAALGANSGMQRIKAYDPARLSALNGNMAAENSLKHLVLLDLKRFVWEPFINPWDDSTGRQYIQNYFWKTSLFGEWGFHFPGAAWLARGLSVLLLALLLLGAIALARARRPAFPLLLGGVSMAAIYYYRLKHPYCCNADFRFVHPVVVAIPAALAQLREGLLLLAARALAGAFLGSTAAFFALFWAFSLA